ncbi:hypothetical protein ACN20G_27675 (plasmid) [Streptomyces sp. BI20]|uniref:hypothetical protein n=1 Tax=Streptomyces sp. BI20 TaxID=3403460 RepID=UPI003C757FB8
MASLNYDILTDPTPLRVPEPGEEVRGAVHIVLSNPTFNEVIWHSVQIRVPVGQGAGDLTVDPKSISVGITHNTATGPGEDPTIAWDEATGVLTVTAKDLTYFKEAGALGLVLSGFPVSDKPGLVALQVTERAASGHYVQKHAVTLSVLKQESAVPRNFRAEETLVAAGRDVVLRWDGPAGLTYRVHGPDGLVDTVTSAKGPAGWEWSPPGGQEPKRDATYTLTAEIPGSQRAGYHLTTTVHLREPEFESVTATNGLRAPWVAGIADPGRITFTAGGARLDDAANALGTLVAAAAEVETVTATTGVHTPWVEGTAHRGRISFTDQGAQILDDTQAWGTISAATVEVETLAASLVRGRDAGAGWIRFPSEGITVGRGGSGDAGTVTADKVRATGVNTTWVGDVDGGKGWVEFPQSGVNVRRDGSQTWGDIAGDKADLNGVNTKWVQGPTSNDGWIEFPPAGVNVFQGAGSRQWGTVAAATADLNDLETHRARVKERLTLDGGLTVSNVLETQDGPPRLVVHGRLEAQGEVSAAGPVLVGGDLTTKGNFRAQGDSLFYGKLNANGHLSVRNAGAWILHTNDGQVSIQGSLRVHGAFRSDS